MNQDNVNKLVAWIRENNNYSESELRESSLKGGASEDEFNEALKISRPSAELLEYVGVGRRFFAILVDIVVLIMLYWLFVKSFHGILWISSRSFSLIFFAYYILLEWKLAGTLGKLLVGIRVRKISGEKIEIKDSIIRNLMRVIDILPFFYLVAAIAVWNSKKKQRLGDMVARTIVISKNSIK